MKNLKLVKAHIARCKSGNHGGDNCKKKMMEWILDNPTSSFKIAELADELGSHVPTASKALYNLKLDGFVFSKKLIGPNWFIYRCIDFKPVVKVKKKRKTKVSKRSTSWAKALAMMV